MTMTGKESSPIKDTGIREGDPSVMEQRKLPHRASGFSALIQAATEQLSLLNNDEANLCLPSRTVSLSRSDDTASFDGADRSKPEAQTPPNLPEPDPRKQSFPELLMTLALDPQNIDVIAFLPRGEFFAIRSKDFCEKLLGRYFSVETFLEFLDLSQDWGFTRVLSNDNCTGIEVFRHPNFAKGDWEMCSRIRFGESPTDARISALPERARLDMIVAEDGGNNSKRRLSPGFLSRRASETSVSSQKQKVEDKESRPALARRDSNSSEMKSFISFTNVSRTDDLRSIALSITTEKLKISNEAKKETTALVQRAEALTTQTIATEAIETLLRDEGHTKETYLKHEEQLSKSSLPGITSLCTQLFSPKSEKETNGTMTDTTAAETKPKEDVSGGD